MHKLRSKSAIYRFRLAAILWHSRCLLFPLCWGFLAYSIMVNDKTLLWTALIMAALATSVIVLNWIISSRTFCPLCITPVLANKKCVKSRHARKLLGSYRMRVASNILLHNCFRCPYCGEPTSLEVRDAHSKEHNPRD